MDCAICLTVPDGGVLVHRCSNGHFFCADCLGTHREFCRAELKPESPSRPAVCDAAGCAWRGVRRDWEAHLANCALSICQRAVAPLEQKISQQQRCIEVQRQQMVHLRYMISLYEQLEAPQPPSPEEGSVSVQHGRPAEYRWRRASREYLENSTLRDVPAELQRMRRQAETMWPESILALPAEVETSPTQRGRTQCEGAVDGCTRLTMTPRAVAEEEASHDSVLNLFAALGCDARGRTVGKAGGEGAPAPATG